jgi:hypothetical protein
LDVAAKRADPRSSAEDILAAAYLSCLLARVPAVVIDAVNRAYGRVPFSHNVAPAEGAGPFIHEHRIRYVDAAELPDAGA